ncbi:DUF3124 domain-containing protein [Maribacter sp. TH_r10]|uniref:DUF3124 domain-containing protein n=1 Tax=Maribacter sp. TH_r10 TaxID=3082086 RepID=UPI002954F752|nr:DUF3124 domain-containing protein [Maribacter sp. TH_r10]MDV7140781.1 DUF3124 domain-containing protein [Maribacter sp. TH_r10]
MKKTTILTILFLTILLTSCIEKNQNLNFAGEDKFSALELEKIPDNLVMNDTTYVPIYSDIYNETKDTRFNLTATLSLRNTSLSHSIYITSIEYYNSSGKKIKEYLNKPIVLKAMQSVEYVIEENDTSGGTGANFVITWSANNKDVAPIFEGIMISTNGQQGISFTTKGVSISRK